MKVAKTSRILSPLENWQQLPNGNQLLQQTQEHINHTIPRCFGYHLLKLGQLSCQLNTQHSCIAHQINCASSGDNIGLTADLHHLPLQSSSIDLAIIAHELDFSSDPHQLLRELDRVLTQDGTLIISGYNPTSFFGVRSLFKRKGQNNARLFLPNRVIDWLHLLGFEIQQKKLFNFLPHRANVSFCAGVEQVGQRYFPYFCSVYFIVAKKQNTLLTPIKNSFKFKKTKPRQQAIATRSHSKNI